MAARDPAETRSTMLRRAVSRRCPRCDTPAFDTWFGMRQSCPGCGLEFEREPGYWVGAIIVNTTAIFATFLLSFGALVAITWPSVPWLTVLIVTAVVNVIVPTIFYPISKMVWLAMEMSWHPLEEHEIMAAEGRVASPPPT